MIGIVFFHFTDHPPAKFINLVSMDLNWYVLSFCSLGGGVGNCLFVLTTGYLLIDKKINLKRIFYLWLEILFYSILSVIFIKLALGAEFSSISKALLPITNNLYWFMSSYFCLMLFVPILNPLIQKSKIQISFLYLFVFLWIFSILPTFFHQNWMRAPNNIAIFILLYATGAIIKKYQIKIPKFSAFALTFIFTAALIMSQIIIKRYHLHLPITFYQGLRMNLFVN